MLPMWSMLQTLPTASDYLRLSHSLFFPFAQPLEPEIQMALVQCLPGFRIGYLFLKWCKQKPIQTPRIYPWIKWVADLKMNRVVGVTQSNSAVSQTTEQLPKSLYGEGMWMWAEKALEGFEELCVMSEGPIFKHTLGLHLCFPMQKTLEEVRCELFALCCSLLIYLVIQCCRKSGKYTVHPVKIKKYIAFGKDALPLWFLPSPTAQSLHRFINSQYKYGVWLFSWESAMILENLLINKIRYPDAYWANPSAAKTIV